MCPPLVRRVVAAAAALAAPLLPVAAQQGTSAASPSSSAAAAPAANAPLLFQRPSLSRSLVAFEYGGDIWTVAREGGDARRLTAGAGLETNPLFSPDGEWVAFSGDYDGNVDVYVVPTAGGEPKRLTWHPGNDVPVAWSADGKRVVFRAAREGVRTFQLYAVSTDGGPATRVSLPAAYAGSFAGGGARMAYMPTPPAFDAWKRYRGGRTTPIWLVDMGSAAVEKVPRDNSNDFNPMWVGDKVYFLSDRGGGVTLYAYDTRSHQVAQVVPSRGLDVKSASASADAIVLERFGALELVDLASGQLRPIPVRVAADIPSVRPRWANVAQRLTNAGLSPSGVRAVFEARGEILTVPSGKGDMRNLTNTPGVAERDPAWSPNGKWIAYFSDESGEYALHLRDQKGTTVRKIALPPSFYYQPIWSPDSRKIAFHDKRLTLWYIDVSAESPRPVKVDSATYEVPVHTWDPSWSPDSRWLAYAHNLPNYLNAVFVFSLADGRARRVTDAMSDARFAQFDKSGKYLFFTASTDAGPGAPWLDMSSYDRPTTRSVYAVVLRRDLPSPVAPESDEETDVKAAATAAAGGAASVDSARAGVKTGAAKAAAAPPNVSIDFDGIDQRVVALPVPARNYVGLAAGAAGTLWIGEREFVPIAQIAPGQQPPTATIHKYDVAKRKVEKALDGVSRFYLSATGDKVLYQQGEKWIIATAAEPAKTTPEATLKTADLTVRVDPRAEWRQMYEEAWRIQRDFFYDPSLHGVRLAEMKRRYQPWVAGLSSRAALTSLFQEMFGELTVGHLYVQGGDVPQAQRVPGGLLGADYAVDRGRYRFAKIYSGENWNPRTQAPLTQPGVNVRQGEYLLSVNGRDVRASEDVDMYFEGTAGKQVVLRVGPSPDGAAAREVTVVPIADETPLRQLAWIEGNRRWVDKATDGRAAYVYLPNTAVAGFTNFNRYYFAQVGKEAAVIDERFNGGGSVADYIVDQMRRPLVQWLYTRDGQPQATPAAAIYGPKVMLVNEYAGSGGDELPWLFRRHGIGKVVGTRTWGGLVGIFDYPPLIDGGTVTAPRVAITNLAGELDIENIGVAPDIEVEIDPKSWREGRDPQLERAVAVVLEELKQQPRRTPPAAPKYPNYQTRTTAAAGSQ